MLSARPNKRRVLVVGMDGASWKILYRLFEGGYMSYLKHLLSSRKMIKSILYSTLPPLTPPSWTSIATGVNPGKHGIFEFHKISKLDRGFLSRLATAIDIKYPRIHEILSFYKLKSIIINLPLSYPLDSHICNNCIIVADWMSPVIEIYPRKLNQKYIHYFKKHLTAYALGGSSKANLKRLVKKAEIFAEGVLSLLEESEWDFAFIVFSETDWSMHYNPEFVSGRKINAAAKVFDVIDKFIRRIHSQIDDLIIVSDHGFNTCPRATNIPYYFKRYGVASISFQEAEVRIKNMKIPLRIVKFLRRSKKLKAFLRRLLGSLVKEEAVSHMIGYEKAQAIMPGAGIIYTKPGYRGIVKEVLKRIPNIKAVFHGEDVYWGEANNEFPDLIVVPECDYAIGLKGDKPFIEEESTYHSMEGIFGLISDIIDESWVREKMNTWDIVPLIAGGIYGLPIPHDTDGYYPDGLKIKKYNYTSKWRIARRAKGILLPRG